MRCSLFSNRNVHVADSIEGADPGEVIAVHVKPLGARIIAENWTKNARLPDSRI
jgi:hypothetical protein